MVAAAKTLTNISIINLGMLQHSNVSWSSYRDADHIWHICLFVYSLCAITIVEGIFKVNVFSRNELQRNDTTVKLSGNCFLQQSTPLEIVERLRDAA